MPPLDTAKINISQYIHLLNKCTSCPSDDYALNFCEVPSCELYKQGKQYYCMNCASDHAHAPKSVIKHCFELSAFWEASVKETAAFN